MAAGIKTESDEISLKKMLLISILLHLLLFMVPLRVFIGDARDALARQLKDELEEMTFIFVETPEDAVESPVEQITPFISDKNLAASNPQAPGDLPAGQPYQEGESEIPAMLPEPEAAPPAPPGSEQEPRPPVEESAEQRLNRQSFDALRKFEALSRLAPPKAEKTLTPQPQPPGKESRSAAPVPPPPRFDNRQSRAPVGAEFRLSTYDWNWAPYLKELKKRIQSNIYPPPAFYMGLVRGRTFLRFKILQDGSITDFELITYTGHESLMNTSVHSIEASVPFLPLPSDFPEDFLGITVGFYYNEFIR